MKKLTGTFLCVATLVIIFLGCAGQPDAAQADMGSGKITIYTSMYPEVIESLRWAVKRQFPGCAVQFVYGGTGEIQDKVAAEAAAKKLGCDMLMVADPAYSMELKEKGMLHRYIPNASGSLAFDYDTDGYWYPVRVSNMVLAFNPQRNGRDTIPHSFYDFAYNAGVNGRIAMGSPLTSGTTRAAIAALRDKYGDGYFAALGKQNVQIEAGAASLAKLETGEYSVVMILEESVLQKQQEEMSALQVIYPDDGTIMIPSTIMTIAQEWSANKNTKTAELITEWFLSRDGQSLIVDGWMHSVRKNFPRMPYGAIPTNHIQSNTMPVNWENCYHQRGEIQASFEAAVIRVVR